MSTEYHQLPSQQGKMPLDYIVDNDPWLISATSNLSLDSVTWGPATKSPVLSQAPSPKVPKSPLYEHVGHDSDGWLKSSVTLDSPMKVKSPVVVAHPTNIPKEFFSTASKIDAWTVQTIPSVDSKKKAQLKQQQQQQQLQLQQAAAVAAQVLSPLLSASMQLQEDEDIKAIEDELAIQNRYKTELCKSFTETGVCRYGSKCQFAHGKEEVRPILRHPKYKTETCKTFHSTGTCPYGIRCRFIHTRAKEESIVYAEEDSLRASGKVAPPPGIPVPQWSKSWSPNASIGSPQLQTKKSSGKKHGLGKIQLVESAPDY